MGFQLSCGLVALELQPCSCESLPQLRRQIAPLKSIGAESSPEKTPEASAAIATKDYNLCSLRTAMQSSAQIEAKFISLN